MLIIGSLSPTVEESGWRDSEKIYKRNAILNTKVVDIPPHHAQQKTAKRN